MNSAQNKLVQMLAWYHDFCMKYGLRYYIVGGTCLGAVRHQGFIPWDDDIDVAMPRADYERLQEYWKQDFNEKYFLQSYEESEQNLCMDFTAMPREELFLLEQELKTEIEYVKVRGVE